MTAKLSKFTPTADRNPDGPICCRVVAKVDVYETNEKTVEGNRIDIFQCRMCKATFRMQCIGFLSADYLDDKEN